MELEPRSRISFLDEASNKLTGMDFKDLQEVANNDEVFMILYHAMSRYAQHHHRFMIQKNGLTLTKNAEDKLK